MNWTNWILHPIDTLAAFGVKKYVLGVVNNALKAHGESIEKARRVVSAATAKLKAVIRFFDGLEAKLEDNEITAEEISAAYDDAKRLASELTA